MFKNFFKRPPKSDPASPAVLEGEKQLEEARKELNSLYRSYSDGTFSGHPEDLLETIEDFERHVQTLTKAKKRGWVPSEKVINGIKFDMEKQREYMIAQSYSEAEIDSEMSRRQQTLDEALLGIR